ncbi:uncharacterized protein [Narcine bancroftii]|uniref:uncharacterized protein isoform X5 n=1 Tax=Narcine bancroftii TaxID=1343680 RepID=UPI00383176B1
MSSHWVCLCGVLLTISVQGYNYSYYGWTMSGADVVSAVEGASAMLPCRFTHPPTEETLTGTIMWYKIKPGVKSTRQVVFNCTYPSLGSSRCDRATQEVGGGRFTFVGNLSQRDASVMVDRLSREDEAQYWCRMELNIINFITLVTTNLKVRAPDGNCSMVSGTEGDSVTLPCVFKWPLSDLTLHTVTWMVKDPYRHIVTFRQRSGGSWVAESNVTRYELVGDPEHGNASTQINQLSVEDSHTYLCLVESSKPAHFRYKNGNYGPMKTLFIHLTQCKAHLVVSPVSLNPIFIYVPVLLVLLMTLGIILLIFQKKVNLCLMICTSGPKRNAPSSTSPAGRGEKKQQSASDTCTYASLVIGGGEAQAPEAHSAGDNCSTYDNAGPNNSEKGDIDSSYENLVTDEETADNDRTYETLMTNMETDNWTYASLVIGGGEAQAPEAHSAGDNCSTYDNAGPNNSEKGDIDSSYVGLVTYEETVKRERMSVRAVSCSQCRMWEVLKSSSLTDIHICARYAELRLLRGCIRELELQLDDLTLVRESEDIIDRSYSQVVTPGPREEESSHS